MTPSPDLIDELRAARPVAPAAVRARVREIAAAEPAAVLSPRLEPARPAGASNCAGRRARGACALVRDRRRGRALALLTRDHPRRERPDAVLVAKQLIPKGTPGNIVASQSMYAPTTLPRKEVEVGSIADPSYLAGRAASVDIFPGQQFSAADFAATDTLAVDSQVAGATKGAAVGPTPDRAQRVSATLTVEVARLGRRVARGAGCARADALASAATSSARPSRPATREARR